MDALFWMLLASFLTIVTISLVKQYVNGGP